MIDDEKLRADARENREHILAVAREALAADPAVSLNSIARAAGVGAGTLYRHFPNRGTLVLGVYRKEIDELVALVPLLLGQHLPLQAFRLWCERLATFGRVKHEIADILHAARTEQDIQETYWPLLGAVRQMMEACADAGELRRDVNAEDFLLLLGFFWQIPPTPAGEARVKRLVALIFRGLGARDDW